MILQIRQNLKQQDLDFRIDAKDIPTLIKNFLLISLIGFLFYGSFIGSVCLLPLSIPWFFLQKRAKIREENHEIGLQFRDAMMAVSTSQKAGYSIENSFIEAEKDMILLYGKKSPICRELRRIEQGIKNNINVEDMIKALGKRTSNKDIEEFAQVFAISKRSGGNMTETIERCVDVIGKRMEVENEIDVLIAAKRMEARIMEIVPFGIMAYVGITNPGFFKPLYGNLFGIAIMTGCLFIYIVGFLLSEKIVTIEI